MANYGVPRTVGLKPDERPVFEPWLEASGVAFAVARREAGKPGDPLLFALLKAHRRLHDGRRVDAAERERIAEVLVAPRNPAPPVPMVETQPDDEAPAELAPRLKRRSRVADLVPAGKVTGWVPQWKREPPAAAGSEPAPDLIRGQSAVGSGVAERATATPQSAPQVAPSPEPAPATSFPRAPVTAREAGAPAVPPPSAGAPIVVAPVAPARQSTPAAPPPGGKRVRAARQRPAAAPASVPPRSPAAAERGEARPRKDRPSIEHIVAVAERAAGIEPGALVPESRRPAVTEARQIALFLAETLLGWDYSRLGRFFGRDRASVRYAIGVVFERRRQDEAFARRLRKILAEARAEPRARRRKIAP